MDHYYVKVPNLCSKLLDHNFQYGPVSKSIWTTRAIFSNMDRTDHIDFALWFHEFFSKEYKMLIIREITIDFDRFWLKRETILIWNLHTIMFLLQGRIGHIDFSVLVTWSIWHPSWQYWFYGPHASHSGHKITILSLGVPYWPCHSNIKVNTPSSPLQ